LRNPSPGSAAFFPAIRADWGAEVDAAAGFSSVMPLEAELTPEAAGIEDAGVADDGGEAA
jgi:hypothetical protein